MVTIDAVCLPGGKGDAERARRLAEKFGVPLVTGEPEEEEARYLVLEKAGLTYAADGMRLRGDLSRMLPRVTGGHLAHELLLKAAGQDPASGKLRAVDATAGLGEDAFLLAAAGYHVELCEHNPITALLLQDALIRAKSDGRLRQIASRMTLHMTDSKDYLTSLPFQPDLIYLDPMFPEKKKSSQTKAKLQVLHGIEAPCDDEVELVRAALAAGPTKILIKRPPDGPYLAGIRPAYSLERKAIRYDCLVPGRGK